MESSSGSGFCGSGAGILNEQLRWAPSTENLSLYAQVEDEKSLENTIKWAPVEGDRQRAGVSGLDFCECWVDFVASSRADVLCSWYILIIDSSKKGKCILAYTLLPVFGGCTATILHGLTYPKILCMPKREKRKRENGDIVWHRSSLSLKLWRKGKTSGDATRKCSKV